MIVQSPDQSNAVSGKPTFLLPMTDKQKREFALLVSLWLAANVYFWIWWLSPQHNIDSIRYLINTLALFWTAVMPAYYLFFVRRLKFPNPGLVPPVEMRVAMVATKVPSESTTTPAMSAGFCAGVRASK